MGYRISDSFYDEIEQKVNYGIYIKGKDCSLTTFSFDVDITDFPMEERTPEICTSFMEYGSCSLSDVPDFSRTREFYINNFTNKEVYDYIKNHIAEFDRQFFKDLIETNKYAMSFENNCFSVMPVEYIDEEMCSLAILKATDWHSDDWFYSVYERNPDALSEELWKLGARLYARMEGNKNRFLEITPEIYKDMYYYREMCMCNFNYGMSLDTNKGRIMETVPKEAQTLLLLAELLADNMNNVSRFSDYALEMEFPPELGYGNMKVWQFVVQTQGNAIKFIPLNDERVEFFLNHYDKDSFEYRLSFKDIYKQYIKEKKIAEEKAETKNRTSSFTEDSCALMVLGAFANSFDGINPTAAVDAVSRTTARLGNNLLPIKYNGSIPDALLKKYDSEEYLMKAYNELGIKVIEEFDHLFYNVELPKGFSISCSGYQYDVINEKDENIINFFYDSKIHDREAYVSNINLSQGQLDNITSKVFVKKEGQN